MSGRVAACAAALAGITLTLGACSSSTDSEGADRAAYLPKSVAADVRAAQQKTAPDLKVDRASCPPKVELKKGTSFLCTVRVAGVSAPYRVSITSLSAAKASYHYKPAKAIVSVAVTQRFLRQQVEAQGFKGVTISCGKAAVVVQEPGTTFPCTLAMGGQTQTVNILIKNLGGTIAISQ